MEAAAVARPRGRRWTNVFERPGVLASVLISPAVIFVAVLVSYVALMARHVRRALAELDELSGRVADRRDD